MTLKDLKLLDTHIDLLVFVVLKHTAWKFLHDEDYLVLLIYGGVVNELRFLFVWDFGYFR